MPTTGRKVQNLFNVIKLISRQRLDQGKVSQILRTALQHSSIA